MQLSECVCVWFFFSTTTYIGCPLNDGARFANFSQTFRRSCDVKVLVKRRKYLCKMKSKKNELFSARKKKCVSQKYYALTQPNGKWMWKFSSRRASDVIVFLEAVGWRKPEAMSFRFLLLKIPTRPRRATYAWNHCLICVRTHHHTHTPSGSGSIVRFTSNNLSHCVGKARRRIIQPPSVTRGLLAGVVWAQQTVFLCTR